MRVLLALLVLPVAVPAQPGGTLDSLPPPVARELRAVWVATVNNIDWPSRPDLTTWEQQQELLAILNRATALKMNAIVFQVRPVADAFYVSRYEPWSRWLTGRQGRQPIPLWDPLAFAVAESHKRGLELHAWFNPYRVSYSRDSLRARNHVSTRRPDLVVSYGRTLWMDPGIPEVRSLMVRAVMDVVRRYDVDGVHIDDYFYPYPELDASQQPIEFPDSASYAAYRRGGGALEKNDWRRRNVDLLVRQFYAAVKAEKPWVKVGISPFGIWRPGNPPQIQGFDAYDRIFADARKWLIEGWVDYLAPQLYWPIYPPEQSYPALLQWWVDQNRKGRHIWPGLGAHRLALTGPRAMRADEIVQQIQITRDIPGATGTIIFNAKILMQNSDSIVD
ncbi:MAG: glycoside hydrolase family 10 protein, partial [Panacagrimonas sp.]